MKKISSITYILLTCFLSLSAINEGNIALGIGRPDFDSSLDPTSQKALVSKLQSVIMANGIGSTASDFVIIPKVYITGEEIIEGGMKNIYRIEGQLSLEVIQLSSKKIFGTLIVNLYGNGMRDKSAAMKNAIGKISTHDNAISSFFSDIRKKIAGYYITNKAEIINKARTAAAQDDYEAAIATLATYPEGLEGSSDINREIATIFSLYRKKDCEQAILQARGAMATQDNELAASILSEVDPDSPCASTATSLLNSLKSEARADTRDALQRDHDMEKARINAARDIAKAYYQRTQPTYNLIFR